MPEQPDVPASRRRAPRRRTDPGQGLAALAAWAAGDAGRDVVATAVRWSLEELAQRAPGRSVEVRVSPFGVVQCVPGPRHTRGTPPNVVETDAGTWLDLVSGRLGWQAARDGGRLRSSGRRADVSAWLPLAGVAAAPDSGTADAGDGAPPQPPEPPG